ncbi:helix-turn-helix transcriptional regulator [Endozoicomonas sp. ALE010]|uniref:helix-turn-helix transcriptional regulator n=1 Tax=Endozoicomonas sp. ALE010 TaxID=3403081 RepID=UPI003BB65555
MMVIHRDVNTPVCLTETSTPRPSRQMIRRQKILEHFDLSRATLYRLLAEKKFPAPVYLPGGGARWILSEVEAWAEQRIQEREG